MEENKFERQVQQKMDELKIQPADSVWENIKVRIEKKKRSNRGLIFFLLLFCFFLIGGYIFWNVKQQPVTGFNNPAKAITNDINAEKAAHITAPKTGKNLKQGSNLITGPVNQKIAELNNASEKKDSNKSLSQRPAFRAGKVTEKINPGQQAIAVDLKQPSFGQQEKDNNSENGDHRPGTAPQQNIAVPKDIQNKVNDSAEDSLDINSSPKLSSAQQKTKEADSVQQTATSSLNVQHANSVRVKHEKKNTWKPGLSFSAGISSVSNSLLNEDKSLNLTDPSTSGSFPPGTVAQPSPTKSGFGFTVGGFIEKNIFSKVKLEAGINFKSFNTSNKVGTRNDTTGFYDYRVLSSANSFNRYNVYNNHYYFIELPVTVKVQIGSGKNIPVIWEGGLVISHFLSSNALQFNPGSGYYYKDNSLFNKTQIGLNTAIGVLLFSKQKNSILTGPYFYYSTSVLANKGLYDNKHFVFAGLRTEILFGK